MKEIALTKGQIALVDDADFDFINQWKWYAFVSPRNNTYYAARKTARDKSNFNKRETIIMHRQIMGVSDPKIEIDHEDKNGLNNSRSNLRQATRSQNNANRSSQINSSSKYLGVNWDAVRNKWRAMICKDNKRMHIGMYFKEEDAAIAYNTKAIELHGEFANLNVLQNAV